MDEGLKSDVYCKNTKYCLLDYPNKLQQEEIFKIVQPELEAVEINHLLGLTNSIFKGDNLLILSTLLHQYRGKIDLIYIDPPFGTNHDFITYDGITAYSDSVTDYVFIEFIRRRLYFLRELLSLNGSIYIHIDKKMEHYIKIILDEVFGNENYINEITRIKCNPKNFRRKAYGNITDTILFYAKNRNMNIWNDIPVPMSPEEMSILFPKVDSSGKRYTTTPLHAPGETRDGPTGQMWKGLLPPKGRHWRYNPDVLTRLDEEGLIEWSSKGNPRKIIYAGKNRGKKVQDVWDYKDKGNTYSSYPTEKSREMLKYIIRNSSNKGSIVLDAFMGSGSFLIEASKLDRNFIGIDSSDTSIKITAKLLKRQNIPYNYYRIKD